MPYTPTTWVEGVTTLGPTNLNHIEQGIATYAPAYGTSLPGSPADGQEAILVDSTTNPSYQWRFRYNNGSSSTYKWELVGGSTLALGSATFTSTSANVWQAGPTEFTLPRNGDWLLAVSSRVANSTGVAAQANVSFMVAGAQSGAISTLNPVPIGTVAQLGTALTTFLGAASGSTVAKAYFVGSIAASSMAFDNGILNVIPVRVS